MAVCPSQLYFTEDVSTFYGRVHSVRTVCHNVESFGEYISRLLYSIVELTAWPWRCLAPYTDISLSNAGLYFFVHTRIGDASRRAVGYLFPKMPIRASAASLRDSCR